MEPAGSQQTSPKRIPWLALSSLLAVVLCIGASVAIIIRSDNQAVGSWMISPSVLLSILAGLSNIALSVAFSEAVVATWWTTAANGASLNELHYIWKRGDGLSFFSALAAGPAAREIARTMLVVISIKVATAPLLQKATHPAMRETWTMETVKLNVAQHLPPGWTGTVENATSIVGSRNVLLVSQAWWSAKPIVVPDSSCHGTCTGKVRGAGIRSNCSSTTQAIGSLLDKATNGAVLFEIATSMSSDSTGMPFLLLTTKYTSAIDNDCFADLTTDTCRIEAGIVEYPITLLNTTISFDPDSLNFLSTYPDSTNTTEGSLAGTLQGLDQFAYDFNGLATLSGSAIFTPDLMAKMFIQTNLSAYTSFVSDNCALVWIRPTDFVLKYMHDFMFRASLSAANDTDSQSFRVLQTNSMVVFHTLYWFPVVASIITLFGVFFVLRLQGWSLRQTVSLSPLETANAFCAPLMENTRYNSTTVEEILKDIGQTEVRYVGGVMVVDDNSTKGDL
jgi:hypothetical protein